MFFFVEKKWLYCNHSGNDGEMIVNNGELLLNDGELSI